LLRVCSVSDEQIRITLEPLEQGDELDPVEVWAFRNWLAGVLNSYDGLFRIESDL